jgi:hypothetical protein
VRLLLTLEDVTRERIIPGGMLIALATLALSLLLAFRRIRLPPATTSAEGQPSLPERLREVRIFRISYAVSLETGRLEADARSARRRWLRTASGPLLPWRTPAGSDDPTPEQTVAVLAGGGRVLFSLDRATGRLAVHEAEIQRLHGLGRRGRGLILWPLFLATLAFSVLTHGALADFLPRTSASSRGDLWLSVAISAALFAFMELVALGVFIGITSAVLRRVRRAQLRRDYEEDLRRCLSGLAETAAPND